MVSDGYQDPNDPNANDPNAPKPPPAAPADPWTPQELTDSQNFANNYYTSHQIPVSYGTPNDLGNAYLQQRRGGASHQDALNNAPGMLGWDRYAAPKAVDAPQTLDYGTDNGILGQIAKWASMPGADPTLASDPNYWLGRIKQTGGLSASNLQYWQDAGVGPTAFFNNPNREQGPASVAPPPGGGPQPQAAPIAPPSTSVGGAPDSRGDDLFNFIMQRAKQSEIVDPNDPMIRSQADTFAANQTREGRRYLSELAERKGAGGNIGAESRMVAEKNAQSSATHEGELVQHEADQRKAEIQQALALGANYMTAQQQMALQKELATIDANMKLYQSQVQQQQFGQSQGQQESQFGRTLTEKQAARAQDQSQFGSTMSERERQFNNDLRQRAYEFDTNDEFRRSPYATPA